MPRFSAPSRHAPGQGLIEGIVAMGIISTAIASALTLTSAAINAGTQSQQMLVAGNLARESVEAVRLIRDSNWLAGQPFDTGLYAAGDDYRGVTVFNPATNAWTVDFAPTVIADNSTRVYRYSTGTHLGVYTQGATQPANTVTTGFNRNVNIDPLCDNGAGGYTIVSSGSNCGAARKIGVRVLAQVRWLAKGQPRLLTAEERMFDWR